MSRYSNIYSDIWLDDKFIALPDSEKLLFVYALTSPIGTYAGFYREPPEYIAGAIKKTREETLELLASLDKKNLVKYDTANNLLLIPNYLKYNTPKNQMQYKGINRTVDKLPLSELHIEFLYRLNKYAPESLEHISMKIKDYVRIKCEDSKDPHKAILFSKLKI
jgi:hypothetical protein